MTNEAITFKAGQCSVVFLHLTTTNLNSIKNNLLKLHKNSPHFLKDLSVVLQLTDNIEKMDLLQLHSLLKQFGVNLLGVSGWNNSLQQEMIKVAQLIPFPKGLQFHEIIPSPQYAPTKVIEQDITAKQTLYAKNSDLIIYGNVEAGAEIAASGNIHVYGRLQGRAIAGVNSSNPEIAIYTQSLEAEFISVSHRFLYKENITDEYWQKAVKISANKNKLILEKFNIT